MGPSSHPDGQKVDAEEKRRDEPVKVSGYAFRGGGVRPSNQQSCTDETEKQAGKGHFRDFLADNEPGKHRHPYGCETGKQCRVGHGRVQDGQMPKEQVSGEKSA